MLYTNDGEVHKGTVGIPIGFKFNEDITGATGEIYLKKPSGDTDTHIASVASLYYFVHVLEVDDIDEILEWEMLARVVQGTKVRWVGPVRLQVIDTPEVSP